jgi:hypothetical protein
MNSVNEVWSSEKKRGEDRVPTTIYVVACLILNHVVLDLTFDDTCCGVWSESPELPELAMIMPVIYSTILCTAHQFCNLQVCVIPLA